MPVNHPNLDESHRQIQIRHEDQVQTYTPLFSPPTPRASPEPSGDPDGRGRRRRSYHRASGSGESGWGTGGGNFVAVLDMQDPLSSESASVQDTTQLEPPSSSLSPSSPPPPPKSSSSLAFFDKFVGEAKKAAEVNRKNVLDEILLHQDDPLFRDGRWDEDESAEGVEVQNSDHTEKKDKEEEEEVTRERLQDALTSALDLISQPEPNLATPPRHFTDPTSGSLSPITLSPRRSPTLTLPTLAPPLASTDTASHTPSPTMSGYHDYHSISTSPHSKPRPSSSSSSTSSSTSSYATLSRIPAKWKAFLSSGEGTRTPSGLAPRPHTVGGSPPTQTHTQPQMQTQTQARGVHHARSMTTTASPFSSHIISAPISGAPGFVDERYDWDKGFSNELLRELEGVPAKHENNGKIQEADMGTVKRKDDDKNVLKRLRGNTDDCIPSSSSFGRKSAEKENLFGIFNLNHGKPECGPTTTTGLDVGKRVGDLIEKKIGSVELKGRKEGTTPVLDVVLAELLRAHLPALDRLPKSWHLVYSLDQHGISLNTLYTRCEAHAAAQAQSQSQARMGGRATTTVVGFGRPGMMVAVKDSGETVFGVWMGEGIRQSRGKGYYGTGDCFMWRFMQGTELSVYKWTGKNKYVALCEPDYISFGGGDGKYGLYLDETLFDGSSARCPTFDNDPLCSPGANKAGEVAFECVGLEVWGIGP